MWLYVGIVAYVAIVIVLAILAVRNWLVNPVNEPPQRDYDDNEDSFYDRMHQRFS